MLLKLWFLSFVLQGLYSSVTCPGLVMTNLTYGILPSNFWTLIMPIMWMVRCHSLFCMFTCAIFQKLLKTLFCFCQTDPNFHQHFYTDPEQWSRGTGVLLTFDLLPSFQSVNTPKIMNPFCFVTVLVVSSKAWVSGSESKISQFNIWTWNKIHWA